MPDASKVQLYDDTTLLCEVNVDGSGNWSKTGQSLSAGSHKIKGKAIDLAGNASAFSSIKNIRTGATETPTCDLLDDSGYSSTDNITNDNTPQIKVDLTLTIPTDATVVHATTVKKLKLYEKVAGPSYNLIMESSSPTWNAPNTFTATFQLSTALSEGNHTFVASWVDQKDNESAKGAELTITVDTTAPNAPAITNINDGQVFIGTSIDISGTAT